MPPVFYQPASIEFADRWRDLESIPSYRAWRAGGSGCATTKPTAGTTHEGLATVRGRVVEWDSPSPLPVPITRAGDWFQEWFSPRSFGTALAANRDVLALINHDDALGILGRTSDGSLCLVEDDRGLSFTLELADDRQGHIVHRALSLGLVKGMSFRFTPGTMIKGRDQCFHTSVEKFAEISFIIGKDKLPAHRSGCSELAIPLSVLRRRLDLLELDAL